MTPHTAWTLTAPTGSSAQRSTSRTPANRATPATAPIASAAQLST
jgi:hypothetical protein